MPGSKSNYTEAAMLDHRYGGPSYTRPATVYMAAFTAMGTEAQTDAGTNLAEPSSGAYARVAITNNGTVLTRTGSVLSNVSTITFPTPTADWGLILGGGVYDAASGGNLLDWATLDDQPMILTGDVLSIAAGAFTIEER